MNNFDEKEYKIFKMFHEQWALVTAGKIEKFNTCTVGWGSLGTLWTRPGKNGAIVTAYLHPARYTREVLQQNDIFTVSFFPNEYRKALGYLGTHSGRNEDKVSASGLSPISIDQGVTFKDGAITSTTSLAEKFDDYNTKMLGDVGLAVSVAGGQQSNSGAYSEAYSQAMAAAAAHGSDYTATKPSYWVTAGGGAAPTFTISQSVSNDENYVDAGLYAVINDENLVVLCNTGKYAKVTNGDNFTKTEYDLKFSDELRGSIDETKYVTADLELMYEHSYSQYCYSGLMRTMLESWISYVQYTPTGGLTGESFNIVNSTYSSVNISHSPAETMTKYYTIPNVIALHGGIKLTGNCSLDSSYRQPRINYGTYLVGNKSFPYYPGANYKYFTLKNMFPDAVKIADNRILTLHDLKYCVCDLDTQTVLHTIPYDVLNSTANVFTWGQEEITNAINLFLKTL